MLQSCLPARQTCRRILSTACVLALATCPRSAWADRVAPAPVPENIQVPEGHRAYFVGRAFGTQNYICLPASSGVAWTLFGPQANLFNDADEQVITHFLSANPVEAGTLRATWQQSRDTSAIWAQAVQSSTDPAFVAPDAIAWLLLRIVGAVNGPTGGQKLTATAYIQRVNTVGGKAPSTGCALSTDVGARVFVPYEADYVMYKARHAGDTD